MWHVSCQTNVRWPFRILVVKFVTKARMADAKNTPKKRGELYTTHHRASRVSNPEMPRPNDRAATRHRTRK